MSGAMSVSAQPAATLRVWVPNLLFILDDFFLILAREAYSGADSVDMTERHVELPATAGRVHTALTPSVPSVLDRNLSREIIALTRRIAVARMMD